MDKLKELELKKLLSQLSFMEIEYEYKTEVIKQSDALFMKEVDSTLERNTELRELYEKKNIEKIEKIIKEVLNESGDFINDEYENEDIEVATKVIPKEVRNIYREIVKLTHPDRVDDDKLKDIYINATECYENVDKFGLYKICDTLNIPYKIDIDDIEDINKTIEDFKNKIDFIESTFTWLWYNSEDSKKNEILLMFIKQHLL